MSLLTGGSPWPPAAALPGAHYPQIHVTTLFDVTAQVPLDAVVGRYGSNEREQLKKLLVRTRPGDALDPGYPSADVFRTLLEAQLDFRGPGPLRRQLPGGNEREGSTLRRRVRRARFRIEEGRLT